MKNEGFTTIELETELADELLSITVADLLNSFFEKQQ